MRASPSLRKDLTSNEQSEMDSLLLQIKDTLLEKIRKDGEEGVEDNDSAWRTIIAITSLRASPSLWKDLTSDEQSKMDSLLLPIKDALLERIRLDGSYGVDHGESALRTITSLSALGTEVSYRLLCAEQAEVNRAHDNGDTI